MLNRAIRLNLPLALLISALIIAAIAAIHVGLGRPLICNCGLVKLFWMGPKEAPEESQHFLDLYSTSHLLHGLIFYFLIWLLTRGRLSFGAGLVISVLLEGSWELFENSNLLMRRYGDAGVEYHGDSLVNSIGDIVSMMTGYVLAAFLPVGVSIAVLIGTEAWMLWYLRDNLTLNIMNLIHPIEWINEWQQQKN
jgi:hypothetical protein